jgi:D-alanyl-lipoteichoic acid acyltransferase DltB (MBOAT superfamily)
LILLTTIVVDYYAAIYIEKHSGPARQRALIFSIVITCLILFVFKYFDFFNINFKHLAHLLNWNYPIQSLKLLLPIGLSFHTFQSLSYVIEVYRRKQKAEKHFGIYALYVMFYPQLVAGPIERPQNLLHQFREQHSFNESQVKEGLLLMAWGFFKKMIIADRLAILVNTIYNDPHSFGGFPLIVATFIYRQQQGFKKP